MRGWTSRLSGLVLPLVAVLNLGVAAILAGQEQGLVARVFTPAAPTSTGQAAYATEQVEPAATLPMTGGELSPTVAAGATTIPSTAQANVVFVPTVPLASPTVAAAAWPATGQAAPPTARPTSRPLPASTPRPRCVKPTNWYKYVVQAGDTLFSIAKRAITTVDALQVANCLPSDLIYAGQVLLVPRPIYSSPTSVPLPSRTPTRWHTATPVPPATWPATEPPTSTPLSMPTETPVPLPTDPPVSVPTDTPPPPPTSTPVPAPTDAPPPPPTESPPPQPTDSPLPTLEPAP